MGLDHHEFQLWLETSPATAAPGLLRTPVVPIGFPSPFNTQGQPPLPQPPPAFNALQPQLWQHHQAHNQLLLPSKQLEANAWTFPSPLDTLPMGLAPIAPPYASEHPALPLAAAPSLLASTYTPVPTSVPTLQDLLALLSPPVSFHQPPGQQGVGAPNPHLARLQALAALAMQQQ